MDIQVQDPFFALMPLPVKLRGPTQYTMKGADLQLYWM